MAWRQVESKAKLNALRAPKRDGGAPRSAPPSRFGGVVTYRLFRTKSVIIWYWCLTLSGFVTP